MFFYQSQKISTKQTHDFKNKHNAVKMIELIT